MIFAGCGQTPQPVVVDPTLVPYFKSFTQNIGVNDSGISGQFANTAVMDSSPLGEVIGECTIDSDDNRDIQIDPTYWANATADQREQLVYHELSHCAMFIGHTPGYIGNGGMNGCPISIMNPVAFGNFISCYTVNKAYYYQELRSHG